MNSLSTVNMKEEIGAAVDFLTRLVGKNEGISADQVEVFQRTLGTIMTEKFKDHWFPEKPCKGQAYRCIRVNGNERRDPILERAAKLCGLRYENLNLPAELTVWVDPLEVCCRFGEDEGSYCTVASFKDNKENLSNNIIEEITNSAVNQNSQEAPKKLKNRRKPLEKQKKQTPMKNYIIPPANVIKGPFINSKNMPNYFDWNPAALSSRFARANGFIPQDLPIMRRPKKAIRSIYPNDRYHWGRK